MTSNGGCIRVHVNKFCVCTQFGTAGRGGGGVLDKTLAQCLVITIRCSKNWQILAKLIFYYTLATEDRENLRANTGLLTML